MLRMGWGRRKAAAGALPGKYQRYERMQQKRHLAVPEEAAAVIHADAAPRMSF